MAGLASIDGAAIFVWDSKGGVDGNGGFVPVSGRGGAASISESKDEQSVFKNYSVLTDRVPVASFFTGHTKKLGLHINTSGSSLDQFEVHAQFSDGLDWVNLGLTDADFTTPNYPVLKSNITNISAIEAGNYYIELDTSSYYRVLIKTASSSSSEVQISSGELKNILGRLVKNEFPLIATDVANLSTAAYPGVGTASYTEDSASGEVTYQVAAGGGRVITTLTKDLVAGEWYAMSVDIVSVIGTISQQTLYAAGGVSASEGVISNVSLTAGTRAMIVFRAATDVSGALFRFGIGVNANETNDVTVVMKNLMVQSLGDNAANVGSYVPYGHTLEKTTSYDGYWDASNNTFIEAPIINKNNSSNFYSIFVASDSFGNDSNDFPRHIDTILGHSACRVYSIAGKKLVDIAADIDSYFDGDGNPIMATAGLVEYTTPANIVKPCFGIIAAGVNDINGLNGDNSLGGMQAALQKVVNKYKTLGMTPVIVSNSPWKNYASFSNATYDQLKTDNWFNWLQQFCLNNGYIFVDIYHPLEDKTDQGALASSATRTGTYDGAGGAVMEDSTANFVPNGLVGLTITNTTDGSTATIAANTRTTVTGTLSGGSNNAWTTGDAYSLPSNDYDSGDGLHPDGTNGMRIIAEQIVNELFKNV